MKVPRIVLAGAASGVGKTSITCAIIYGLKRRGFSVQPFKAGPDYIDPSYLSSVSGNEAHNLDVWMMGVRGLRDQFLLHSGCDISVVEGVMGYYDGFSGGSNRASTYHVAATIKSNAILVLDAAKTARSIAATSLGFTRFHKKSRISGIILNKIGGKRHEKLCREALQSLGIPIVGIIPRNSGLSLDSRHLGLVPVAEDKRIRAGTLKIAKEISEYLDFDLILKMARDAEPLPKPKAVRSKRPRCTVAVALDGSFNFYYSANLDALRREGARIKFFSPVSDKKPPGCDGIYIGGGFPEVLSGQLSKNSQMRKAIKKAAEGGVPIYAECGGLMYLTRSIRDDAKRHAMAGVLDADTKMTKKMTLNYTRANVVSDCLLSRAPRRFHGHEFHYSELEDVPEDARFAYDLETGRGILQGKDGIMQENLLASYGHLFFDSKDFAAGFVSGCVRFSKR